MAFRAKLDADRIYWGVEDVDEPAPFDEATGEGDFEVPADCDLRPGAYRLAAPDDTNFVWHFKPLERAKQPAAPAVPSFERAMFEYLTQGVNAKAVQDWLAYFPTTMDGR